MQKKWTLLLFTLLIIIANIGIDRVTKIAAEKYIKGQGTIEIIGTFAIFQYAENNGAFLSAGSAIPQPYKDIILILLPVLLIVAALYYVLSNSHLTRGQIVALASVIGGGTSNIFDRIFNNGYVVDFLNFGIGPLRTGILNVADISITFGALYFLSIQYLLDRDAAKKDKIATE